MRLIRIAAGGGEGAALDRGIAFHLGDCRLKPSQAYKLFRRGAYFAAEKFDEPTPAQLHFGGQLTDAESARVTIKLIERPVDVGVGGA